MITVDLSSRKRLALSIGMIILVVSLILGAFIFMRDSGAAKGWIVIFALITGVGGVWAMFYTVNYFVEALPKKVSNSLRPYVFVGPAVIILSIYIVFPAVRTIWLSFFNRTSDMFVGLANYIYAFTDSELILVLRNTLLWVVLVPAISVALGLIISVLVDRLSTTSERVVKSMIFLPLAISFVSASVIWRFVYYFQPAEYQQIGLLNAIVVGFGGEPQAWITQLPWKDIGVPWLNNLFLIFIMIWLQTGFAMMIISASLKGVPRTILEAARIDGAGEIRIFFRIIVPWISGTLLTVTTTILFSVLKIFDIVFTMTSGNFDTDVVASRMYFEAFKFRDFGRGSALAVILFLAVVPFIVRNIKRLQREG